VWRGLEHTAVDHPVAQRLAVLVERERRVDDEEDRYEIEQPQQRVAPETQARAGRTAVIVYQPHPADELADAAPVAERDEHRRVQHPDDKRGEHRPTEPGVLAGSGPDAQQADPEPDRQDAEEVDQPTCGAQTDPGLGRRRGGRLWRCRMWCQWCFGEAERVVATAAHQARAAIIRL